MSSLNVKIIKGLKPYLPTWEAMRSLTSAREADRTLPNELWLLEHDPVFTQGQAGKAEHILNPHQIPIVQTDRGGQVTYHGPGQLMIYTLFDLKTLALNTRTFVHTLEQTVIDYLDSLSIQATSKPDAPGVYVEGKKICSIGLRVRKGFAYHGLAFNIDMDLTPFTYINPCGFKSLQMTQLSQYKKISLAQVIADFLPVFLLKFSFNQVNTIHTTSYGNHAL